MKPSVKYADQSNRPEDRCLIFKTCFPDGNVLST